MVFLKRKFNHMKGFECPVGSAGTSVKYKPPIPNGAADMWRVFRGQSSENLKQTLILYQKN